MNRMAFFVSRTKKNMLLSQASCTFAIILQNPPPAHLPPVSAAFTGVRKKDTLMETDEYPEIEAMQSIALLQAPPGIALPGIPAYYAPMSTIASEARETRPPCASSSVWMWKRKGCSPAATPPRIAACAMWPCCPAWPR